MTPELTLVFGTLFAAITLGSLGLSFWACHMTIKANIKLVGLENSTHQVQYMPLPDMPQGEEDQDIKVVNRRMRDLEHRQSIGTMDDIEDDPHSLM